LRSLLGTDWEIGRIEAQSSKIVRGGLLDVELRRVESALGRDLQLGFRRIRADTDIAILKQVHQFIFAGTDPIREAHAAERPTTGRPIVYVKPGPSIWGK
jgi:hypothetical protein